MITVHLKQRRIFIPLLPILPLILIMEIIAFIPITVYAMIKREFVVFKVAYGFYLSRFIIALILYGQGLKIITGEFAITGEYTHKAPYFRSDRQNIDYLPS